MAKIQEWILIREMLINEHLRRLGNVIASSYVFCEFIYNNTIVCKYGKKLAVYP